MAVGEWGSRAWGVGLNVGVSDWRFLASSVQLDLSPFHPLRAWRRGHATNMPSNSDSMPSNMPEGNNAERNALWMAESARRSGIASEDVDNMPAMEEPALLNSH